ncbi:MAG: hypothetical protein HKN44_15080 [Ilumatobacter sp.]|nr:hypothetical protein [Ilumatobacter sp.]
MHDTPVDASPSLPQAGPAGAGPVVPSPVGPPLQPLGVPGEPLLSAPAHEITLTPEGDEGAESSRERSRIAVVGIVVAVLALGIAGVFAVSRIGGGNEGGAGSPAEVGTALMASIEQEDVLGMIDLLLPGERDALREPLIDTISELSRLEVLSSDASLADLSGIDFELNGEATDVVPTNVSDIANITMTASMTATLDGAQLPVGALITDRLGDSVDLSEVYEQETDVPFELPMTVVERDGRWYLSLAFTAAEAARGPFGDPIPVAGIQPSGGSTPEGAIDAVLAGVEQLDLARTIAAINPNEAEALQRYAPLFLGDAQAILDEVPLDWRITDTEYAVEGDGSKRFVEILRVRIEGQLDGESFTLAVADGCATVEADGFTVDSCAVQQGPALDLDDVFADPAPLERLSEEVRLALDDYDQPGITVQLVDGQWYVSPVGTGFDQMLALLRALDRDELDRIIERGEEAVDAFFGEIFGGFPGPGGGPIDEFTTIDEPADAVPAPDEPVDERVDAQMEAFEIEQRIATECYSSAVLDDVVDCLRTNIASGALPEYYLSIELEHPECGVGEVSIGAVSLYELTDEAYSELVTTASACFGGLIESGAVQQTDVPPEYLRPECSEGRNPWNFEATDSEELFDRWLECVYS